MGSPLPEDPYLALGLPKDATANAIKTQYRKLVLKFHPDKVQDEALKQAAVDQFHKIQTAYEIVGDEDRRGRYDAQCKLAQLKKEVMERQGGGGRGAEVRTAAYKMPTETARGGAFYARGPERTAEKVSPQYEERRPSGYAKSSAQDYFEAPRASARKDTGYEQTRRPSPRDDRERTKAAYAKESRENEKVRQRERDNRRERDIKKDRDRKTAYVREESESDSEDEYERAARRRRPDETLRKAREDYHEQARKDKEDAVRGYYDTEERARKLYAQYDGAREYMQNSTRTRQRSPEERRPSPVRMSSSKDKMEYIKRSDGRPSVMVRRGSTRPKGTDERRGSTREAERRSSLDDPRKPPPLMTSKSSPAEIHMPAEKQRSQSVQVEPQEKRDFTAPKFKRSETAPHLARESRRKEPQKGSSLRQTEIVEGYATPAATPVDNDPSPSKYRYHQEYADDHEYPTPDGYRTELREPNTGAAKARYTRSPSPMRERERDKARAASARYPTVSTDRPVPLPRTTSTSYVYSPGAAGVEAYSRPSISRENSRREGSLYGEIPTTRDTRSPRQTHSKWSPPPDDVRYQKAAKPEDIRMQSGYGSRRPSTATRPSYTRHGSYVK